MSGPLIQGLFARGVPFILRPFARRALHPAPVYVRGAPCSHRFASGAPSSRPRSPEGHPEASSVRVNGAPLPSVAHVALSREQRGDRSARRVGSRCRDAVHSDDRLVSYDRKAHHRSRKLLAGSIPCGGTHRRARPVTERPVTERPVTERPVTERPVTERPVTERPVTERPVTERPVTERPRSSCR
jgi:hypothetical protein